MRLETFGFPNVLFPFCQERLFKRTDQYSEALTFTPDLRLPSILGSFPPSWISIWWRLRVLRLLVALSFVRLCSFLVVGGARTPRGNKARRARAHTNTLTAWLRVGGVNPPKRGIHSEGVRIRFLIYTCLRLSSGCIWLPGRHHQQHLDTRGCIFDGQELSYFSTERQMQHTYIWFMN